MNEINRNHNFISITRPMYYFSKFGGVHLFNVEQNGKLLPFINYDIIDIFLFTLFLSVNIYLFHTNIQSLNYANLMHSFVIDRGLKILLSFGLSNSIYQMIWNFKNSNKILINFKNFIQFDNEVCL